MQIALGPLLYYWPRQQVLDFYAAMADTDVDLIYLGETVCSRRHELRSDDWLALADDLSSSGKGVILSTLTLIESESDLKATRRLIEAAAGRYLVEANEMGAVRLLAERKQPWVAGPGLNVFNGATLGLLAAKGACRWVMPTELSASALHTLQDQRPTGLQTEVFAHGHLALAHSARCFTARRFNLQKDSCGFRCIDYPRGLALQTREGEPFLTLNGVQTLSAKTYNLAPEVPRMVAEGVDVVRISPEPEGTERLLRSFRDALAGHAPDREHLPADACNGFWHGRPGLDLVKEGALP